MQNLPSTNHSRRDEQPDLKESGMSQSSMAAFNRLK